MLRAIVCEGVAASSSTGSKGEWSPEAKDLYCLLNKKRIEREKEEEKKQETEKRGEDLRV